MFLQPTIKKNAAVKVASGPFKPHQRKCSCGKPITHGGECAECRRKREAKMQQMAPVKTRIEGMMPSPDNRSEKGNFFAGKDMGHNFGKIGVHNKNSGGLLSNSQGGATKSGTLGMGQDITRSEKKTDGPTGSPLKWTADIESKRYPILHKPAMLATQEEAVQPQAADEETTKIAQTGSGSGSGSAAPAPAAPAAAPCTYAITYANITRPGCGARCGAQIVYDVTKVTATGAGCPATLNGLRVTETVTTDNGCTPGGVTTGGGCPIGAGGVVSGCTDTYALCGSAASFPAGGCTEIYTQNLSVGGVPAETRTITFRITKTGGACSGTVTRT